MCTIILADHSEITTLANWLSLGTKDLQINEAVSIDIMKA